MPEVNAGANTVAPQEENEELSCSGCDGVTPVNDTIGDIDGNVFCTNCYYARYFHCSDCGDETPLDDAYSNNEDSRICQTCYNDNYFTCERCDLVYSNDGLNSLDGGESLCDECYMEVGDHEDDEENEDKDITTPYNDKEDIQKDLKATLDSKRTFGIEFEMYGGTFSPVKKLVEKLGFSYSGDGSIRGSYGVEVQTSVLSKGDEDKIRKFTSLARENGYQVNPSCGTHIHLGGNDFADRTKFEMCTMLEAKNRLSVAVETPLYKSMITAIGENGAYHRLFIEAVYNPSPLTFSTYYEMSNGKISRYSVVPLCLPTGREIKFICRDTTLAKLGTTTEELQSYRARLNVDKVTGLFFVEDRKKNLVISVKNVLFFKKEETNNFYSLVNLLNVYYQYNDLFMAMLPKNRANNDFCRPLKSSYTKRDFENINRQEDLERVWYKKGSQAQVEESKGYHYDSSRYHFVNLHSLFGKLGTVEIRAHHGTLNAESILMWVKLHQYILDKIKTGFDYRSIEETDIKKLFKHFCKSFAIKSDSDIYKYMVYRLEKFGGVKIEEEKKSVKVVAENNNNPIF